MQSEDVVADRAGWVWGWRKGCGCAGRGFSPAGGELAKQVLSGELMGVRRSMEGAAWDNPTPGVESGVNQGRRRDFSALGKPGLHNSPPMAATDGAGVQTGQKGSAPRRGRCW